MSLYLSPREEQRLAELESVIERGAQTFIEVGKALMEIKEGRLYRTAENPKRTFEDYVQERWGWSRQWAYRQIQAAEVAENVAPGLQNGETLSPSNAIALSRLDPEEQKEAAPAVAKMSKQEARQFVTERKAERRGLRHIPSSRRHEEFMRAAEHLVKVAGRWEREMTDSLTPPQARKQLTVLEKAEDAISAAKDAVGYRAATLHSFNH